MGCVFCLWRRRRRRERAPLKEEGALKPFASSHSPLRSEQRHERERPSPRVVAHPRFHDCALALVALFLVPKRVRERERDSTTTESARAIPLEPPGTRIPHSRRHPLHSRIPSSRSARARAPSARHARELRPRRWRRGDGGVGGVAMGRPLCHQEERRRSPPLRRGHRHLFCPPAPTKRAPRHRRPPATAGTPLRARGHAPAGRRCASLAVAAEQPRRLPGRRACCCCCSPRRSRESVGRGRAIAG